MSSVAAAIEADDVVLAHGDHVAVASSSLRIPSGCIVACIGPNGSGKSTLLDAITGLMKVRSGTLRVFGEPPGAGREPPAVGSGCPL